MWRQIGRDLIDGIRTGFSEGIDGLFDNAQQFWTDYILYVKHILGIASPSTVFASIGRDIVLGVIQGWTNTAGALLSAIDTTLTDIGNMFGIDLSDIISSGSSASGLGTAGGGTGTTGGGTGGGSTGQVVNNYYGPVYFGSTGEPNSYYDCPSPNPMVASSANQLVTGGF
jgi:hypothetical protein